MVQWVRDPATRAKQQLHRIRAKRGVGGEFPGGEKGWKKQTACGLKNDVNFVTVERSSLVRKNERVHIEREWEKSRHNHDFDAKCFVFSLSKFERELK